MVVPLIVGASRLVVKGSKVASQASRKGRKNTQNRGALSKSLRAKQLVGKYKQRKSQDDDKDQSDYKPSLLEAMTKKRNPLVNVTNYKRLRAGMASTFIFWNVIWFWIPQIGFWMLGIAGLGFETIPFASYIVPGQTLFVSSHVIAMGVGMVTMIYAFMIFSIRLIDAWSGMKGLVFALSFALYAAPFLNFFPWFVLWLISVSYLQGKPKDQEGAGFEE